MRRFLRFRSKLLHIFRHRLQIRFAPVRVHADHHVASVGETNLVEARTSRRRCLRSPRFISESGRRPSGSITSTLALIRCRVRPVSAVARYESTSRDPLSRSVPEDSATHDRRTPRRQDADGKIVGEVLKPGRKQQHVTFADLLVEHERRAVGEPCRDAAPRGSTTAA